MHGNKSQGQRQRALSGFASGKIDTLVATDVAARGIDVEEITRVINFDAPGDRDAYVHRVGRSGRAGRDGAGISFVMPDQDLEMRKIATGLGLTSEFDHARPARNGASGERPARNGGSGSHERTHGGGGGRGRRRRRR
jgi:superfamily II DNA/RNA helicase